MNEHRGVEAAAKFTAAHIVRATGGKLLRGSLESAVSGVSTDTRTLRAGELFVALKGPIHNGHDYLPEAVERGAWGVILQKGERPFPQLPEGPRPLFVIETEDTLAALGTLAAAHRARCPARVAAVTGSVGKTTVKEMAAAVLSRSRRVCATEGNQNNLVGVPLTLFRLRADDECAVVEMGTDRPGEIERLARIARPQIGVITQVAESHLEHFGDLVSVAEEKAQLFRALEPDGHAVLRDEVVFASLIRARSEAPVTTFGLSPEADVRAADVETDEEGRVRLRVLTGSGETPVELPICGRHQVWNALAAFALCELLGIPGPEIAEGLAGYEGVWGRMQRRRVHNGAWLIDDGYNANPASVRAAIETLATMGARSRFLVLGDMLDLGSQTERLHRQIGREISRWPIDDLIVCGERWEEYVEGAMEGGMTPERIHPFTSHDEVIRYVKEKLQEGDVILVKGSRATHMERICAALPVDESPPVASGGMARAAARAPAERTARI